MAQKPMKGVAGVLGSIVSLESRQSEPQAESEPSAQHAQPVSEEPALPATGIAPPRRPSQPKPAGARRGRPPGRRTGESVEKEKVTLRITKDLVDDYRDWSWEERCQLGELVERALIHYRKQRQRRQGN